MADEKLYDVFLSYNSQDREAVEELARFLQDETGLKLWLDRWSNVPGAQWQEELERALGAARACAVFIGPSGIGRWQNEELRCALQERVSRKDFRVIPVLLPGAPPGGGEVPRLLSRSTWVDFTGPKGLKDASAMSEFVAGIRGHAPHGRTAAPRADTPRAGGGRRRKALLILLGVFLWAAAANLLADIAWRFAGGDRPDTVRILVQVLLFTLLAVPVAAAATLTGRGLAQVEEFLTRAGLYEDGVGGKFLLASAVAAALLFGAWLSLPRLAAHYNDLGLSSLNGRDLTNAARYFRRAIGLNPSYAQAHYNLASVYEDWQRDDEAIEEYSRAMELGGRAGRPWNNLARLYIRRGKREDLDRALALIEEALKQTLVTVGQEQDTLLLYTLYKNQGWAYYELAKRYTEAEHRPEMFASAESALRHAVMLRDKGEDDQGAAAHCLLGYVLEAQNKPDAAQHWYDCAAFAPGQNDVETEWRDYADSRLGGGATR
jgi:tetratricopeptide (TPR) repeat protein